MSKYLKLFETTSEYEAYMGGGEKILPNVSLIEETNKVEYNPYIPPRNDIIIYTAPAKLRETTDSYADGLHTNAFNTTIKSHTFENGVGTIEFNDNVTKIGERAFKGCINLTSITIPNSVTKIGYSAFTYCSGLTSITIPNNVTSIDIGAFYQCSSLTSIVVESSNTKYDSRDNCNAIVETATNTLITGCQNTTIPNSVTSIDIGAFESCINLTSITIPNSVTSIGESAFEDCSSLTSVTIGNSVTNIDDRAFDSCSSLISVTVEATTPPTLVSRYGSYGQFRNNASGRKIYVPAESVDTYKSAIGWSDYANDIEAIATE